jgi:hypothetical protein
MRRLSLLLLCAFCYALVLSPGCGGGEDPVPDAGPPPPPPPVDSGVPDAGKTDAGPVDLTPPTVVSYSPADGTIAVPPESLIEVNFSEAMRIDRGTLQLQPGTSLPNNGVFTVRPEDWDFAKKKVLFSFPGRLPVKTRLTASLGNFADLAGNPMPGVVTFTFTTSDGNPPRVTNCSPVENAASVPLDTTEVSFTFSEPMDTRVGTLVPGGGLTLGPTAWIGNQVVSAIITSGLATNGIYTVRLDGFRNVYGKALDGVPTLGDGKLDFGTGPDITKPTVTRASPEEGSIVTPETNLFAVFTFSEPMDKTQGTAVLVDGTTRTTLTPATWSEDGFNVTYDVEFRLRHGATLRIELLGFRDRAGNSLDATAVLGGNSALDFTTTADTTKPSVIGNNIPDGAINVYPVEVYATGASPATAYRKVFTFRFSEPMNTGITRVTLHEANNPTAFRNIDGLWTGPRDLKVTITPPAAGLLPMLDDFAYYLDLTGLKDPAGNSLDVTVGSLGNGRLEFRTLPNYVLLNHACEHAVTLAPTAIAATVSATATSPRTDQAHALYGITLPSNGTSYSGYTRAQLNLDADYTFFLNRNTQVQITDPANSTVNVLVTQEPVVPACPEITHRATFHSPAGSSVLNLRFGPLPEAEKVVRLIVETGF